MMLNYEYSILMKAKYLPNPKIDSNSKEFPMQKKGCNIGAALI